jgi:hypothetical protein
MKSFKDILNMTLLILLCRYFEYQTRHEIKLEFIDKSVYTPGMFEFLLN